MITDWRGGRPILPILKWRGRPVQKVGMILLLLLLLLLLLEREASTEGWHAWSWQEKLNSVCNSTDKTKQRGHKHCFFLKRETVLGNGTVTGSYSWKDDEGMVSFFILYFHHIASHQHLIDYFVCIISHYNIDCWKYRTKLFPKLIEFDLRWDSTSTLQTGLVIVWNRCKSSKQPIYLRTLENKQPIYLRAFENNFELGN